MSHTIERYIATVTDNEDEENRGRIKVACTQLLGDEETELPDFIEADFSWGWFVVPDVGEQVEIEFVTSTETDEISGQALLEGGIDNIKWRMIRPYTDEELDGESTNVPAPIHPDFAENYKRRGFATPLGHILLFDDTEGATKIFLTWCKEPAEPDQALKTDITNTTQLLIDADGSFKVTTLEKTFLHLKPVDDGNAFEVSLNEANDYFKLDGDGKLSEISLDGGSHFLKLDATNKALEISLDGASHVLKLDGAGTMLDVVIDSGAGLNLTGKDADATVLIGDAAVKAAIADHLEALWGDLVSHIDSHTHPVPDAVCTVSGGSGAPAVGVNAPGTAEAPNEATPAWDGAINSNKLKFPDG
jgi:hypothetical protein